MKLALKLAKPNQRPSRFVEIKEKAGKVKGIT